MLRTPDYYRELQNVPSDYFKYFLGIFYTTVRLRCGGTLPLFLDISFCSSVGIGAALRSVADTATSSLGKGALITPGHQLFSSPQPLAESPAVSPSPHHLEDKSTCR